jgi:hypothetical protein
MALLQLF